MTACCCDDGASCEGRKLSGVLAFVNVSFLLDECVGSPEDFKYTEIFQKCYVARCWGKWSSAVIADITK